MKILFLFLLPIGPGVQRIIDLLASIMIIAVLAVTMIHAYLPLMTRAKVLNAASFGLEKSKRDIAVHWALHGQWPKEDASIEMMNQHLKKMGAYVNKVFIQDGAIQIMFNNKLSNKALTCRPAVPADDIHGPVHWACGSPMIESGWVFQGENRTDVGGQYIPLSLK